MSDIKEFRGRLQLATKAFIDRMYFCWIINEHAIATKNGLKIPSKDELIETAFSLIDKVNTGTEACSSAGFQFEFDLDENDEPINGSIGYVTTIASLLGEEE